MFETISNFFTEKYVQAINALRPQKGQTLVEYALLLALIAIIVLAVIIIIGRKACNIYSTIGSGLTPGS